MKILKGNLHTHTNMSDGKISPDEAIRLYRNNGYDFIALTDHWSVSQTEVRDGLLVLSGCEYNFGRDAVNGIYHIVGIGFKRDPGVTPYDEPKDAVKKIHEAGGLADIAHPAWSLNTCRQLSALYGIADYTEIYNTTSDYPVNCRPYSGNVIDQCAARGMYWSLAAVDDTHHYNGDQCKSFIYLNAKSNTEDDVLSAIKGGAFYASQGPWLNTERHGNTVTVECGDGVSMITQVTDSVWENNRSYTGVNIKGCEFEFSREATFMRIEVRDSSGRCAWGQIIKK